MRRLAAIAVAACVASACGGTEQSAQSSRHLDPRSDAVVAIDLDYDSDNWEQVKRLYARAVEEGVVDAGEFTPPTLDEALELATKSAGLSFDDDIKPLLGGTLQIGVRTEPAPPLSPSARDVLEQLDQGATRDGQGGPQYFDYDGQPMDAEAVEEAQREQGARNASTTITAVYRAADADALERVLKALRGQGVESRPLEGIEDARRLAAGVAVLGGDTIVAMLADDDERADAVLLLLDHRLLDRLVVQPLTVVIEVLRPTLSSAGGVLIELLEHVARARRERRCRLGADADLQRAPSNGRMSSSNDKPADSVTRSSASSSVGGVNSPKSRPPALTARAYSRLTCCQLSLS